MSPFKLTNPSPLFALVISIHVYHVPSEGSRLDDYEVKEDDDVFDVVDEENYAKLVEGRREGESFVVDDNGAGYADDGEEVLGVQEDDYDRRRRGPGAAAAGK